FSVDYLVAASLAQLSICLAAPCFRLATALTSFGAGFGIRVVRVAARLGLALSALLSRDAADVLLLVTRLLARVLLAVAEPRPGCVLSDPFVGKREDAAEPPFLGHAEHVTFSAQDRRTVANDGIAVIDANLFYAVYDRVGRGGNAGEPHGGAVQVDHARASHRRQIVTQAGVLQEL